jgi:hypothetical protein
VCRCFDETKAEGALDLMLKTTTSLLEASSSVCDIETLVFRCLLEKHFFLAADDLDFWLSDASNYNAFATFADEIAMFGSVLCLTGERDRRCASIVCYKICRMIQHVRPAVFLSRASFPGLGKTSTFARSTSSFRIDCSVQTQFPIFLLSAVLKHYSIWFAHE